MCGLFLQTTLIHLHLLMQLTAKALCPLPQWHQTHCGMSLTQSEARLNIAVLTSLGICAGPLFSQFVLCSIYPKLRQMRPEGEPETNRQVVNLRNFPELVRQC